MTNEQLIIDELLQEKRMLLGEKEKNEKRIKELEVIIERYKEICKYSSYKIAINTHNIENFRKNKDFHFSHPMTLEHLSFFILNLIGLLSFNILYFTSFYAKNPTITLSEC